ncbi:MAG: hypothetical protein A2408_03570 [Candidatus Yonathbacteria bacterium RIFOXYC1_FULL_52_10]|uniref:DNA recombination protein RmuC n=1 Tax=Candidatus Yonathbacteria bacterium RIFOXYD1_FULL_52_36 TaxID=1802730 RepID=A0A1G2SIT1_9BACT|nr:MAG: hypothetical protein A2408_03570 [Candidatus Yonathbacteria bacterium RIFOXYC1_FULL_52_10]OHA85007.1 MAG: hypothetical protein A2591_02190 [Candidatus Yonathbacteria bacterium RIFOXYD1_FULL_52_36]
MEQTTIIILVLGALIFGALIAYVLVRSGQKQASNRPDEAFLLLQNQLQGFQVQMGELLKTVDSKMGESQRDMRDATRMQFSESQKLIQSTNEQVTKHLIDVAKGVAEANEASKQVFTIADQLQNLEKVLKHQKQRGNLGEASLELSLNNILPPDAYEMQYLFPGGDQVDAIIKTKEGVIPVDAKFSLDNYNRVVNEDDPERKLLLEKDFRNDLKKRIDETAKYIRVKDGTLPFAFMYIPAEGIYYDLLVNDVGSKVNARSLIDYAYRERNVIIVSPTTFSAYLQSVLYGFKAFKIEESAKQIAKEVEKLARHLRAYEDHFKSVGKSLGTTVNHYNSAQKDFGMIEKDIFKITAGETEVQFEPLAIEKPVLES